VLRGTLVREQIEKTSLFYSLAKKDAQTLSFLANERLLIYDNVRRILFYINDFKNTPFRTVPPNPKNNASMPL
jgi:hypothetical protein